MNRPPEKKATQLPCTCGNLRRAARVVTQFYDATLRGSGLRVTQFTPLQALVHAPGVAQKEMAELLGIDSTTLTRTLALLRRKGWVRSESGADRRALRLFLTAAGRRAYKRTLPYWSAAQARLRRALGEANWKQVISASVRIAGRTPRS